MHGAFVNFAGARIVANQHGRDVVGRARIGEGEQRARAGHHAVALVLTIGGVADFFREGEIRVLQRAHRRRVDADVQRLEAIGIARGIQHAVERFGVRARRLR